MTLVVRNGNRESMEYMNDPDYMAKPMDCKAKTAKVGPDQGLVVDLEDRLDGLGVRERQDRSRGTGHLAHVHVADRHAAREGSAEDGPVDAVEDLL